MSNPKPLRPCCSCSYSYNSCYSKLLRHDFEKFLQLQNSLLRLVTLTAVTQLQLDDPVHHGAPEQKVLKRFHCLFPGACLEQHVVPTGGLAPPATSIRSVDWSFRVGGLGGVGSVSSVLLLAYIDFDVDLSTRWPFVRSVTAFLGLEDMMGSTFEVCFNTA